MFRILLEVEAISFSIFAVVLLLTHVFDSLAGTIEIDLGLSWAVLLGLAIFNGIIHLLRHPQE